MRKSAFMVGLLVATFVLPACDMFTRDKDKELKPTELTKIENKIDIKRLWSTNIGDDAEFLRVALQPVGDGRRIYAASRDGNVVAMDPETGKQVWRAEQDMDLSSGPGVG